MKTPKEFEEIANKFLLEIEKLDKDKITWQTKNHIPNLHQSLNEFYIWLIKNYYKNER